MNDEASNLEYARAEVESLLRKARVRCLYVAGQCSAAGNHFAFLVSDADVARGRSLTRKIPGTTVNFYTLAGAKSGGFRLDNPKYNAITLALFPLETADYLLESAGRPTGLDALDELCVAAYIRAYFGGSSRLFGLARGDGKMADLRPLAKKAEVDPAVCRCRASLDDYLARSGWRPPVDMLERLGLADRWIKEKLLPKLVADIAAPPGLTVFFLRERAVEMGLTDSMKLAIEDAGFEILKSLPLSGDLATMVRRSVRGGNWGAGPWPLNGGPPVHLLFAVDVFPVEPDDTTRAQHPFLDNRRILAGKTAARNAVLSGVPSGGHFNALHSADNSAETLRFAEAVLDEECFAKLNAAFLSRHAEVDELLDQATPLDGTQTIALTIRPNRGAAGIVRKIYRRQYLGSLRRDAELLDLLAPQWPELPTVKARGRNYLEFEDVDAKYVPLGKLQELAPIPMVLRLREILRAAAACGFDPVGWDPGQGILVAPDRSQFRIIGFDRPQRRRMRPTLADSICLAEPVQGQKDVYAQRWYPVLGMPRTVFVNRGPVAMRLYRTFVHPLHSGIARMLRAREAFKASLRIPIRALRRMRPLLR